MDLKITHAARASRRLVDGLFGGEHLGEHESVLDAIASPRAVFSELA